MTIETNNTPPFLIKTFQGKEIAPFLDELAQFRIKFFRHFPYLYEGDLAYEKAYLNDYVQDKNAIMIAAFVEDNLVGFVTGIPLMSSAEIVKDAETKFAMVGLNPHKLYYIGEGIISPKYRSYGIAHSFGPKFEKKVIEMGYEGCAFLMVDRPDDHPLKPENYPNLALQMKHFGYNNIGITSEMEWPTIQPDGSVVNQMNKLNYFVCLYSQEAQQPNATVLSRQTTWEKLREQAENLEKKYKR
jgi:hypothetical protein